MKLDVLSEKKYKNGSDENGNKYASVRGFRLCIFVWTEKGIN